MKRTSTLFVAALFATPAFAQGGDDCSIATPITAAGTVTFDTTAATTSGFNGGGSCDIGADTINQDLFWQFTVPAAGNWIFDTVGSSFDTKLSVHAGAGCAATCSGYNDDTNGLQSRVVITGANAGDMLLIQAGGFGTGAGFGTLNVSLAPPPAGNGDCSAPDTTTLTGTGSFAFDTTGAVTSFFDGGGACGAGSDSNNQDLFYTWTAPSAGDFVFDTFGSSYDTKLSIHDGMDCAATCLGYNDDTNGLQSEVSVTGIAAGQVLLVQVGGFGAGEGAGTLTIGTFVDPCAAVMPDAFEDNDDCATATPLGDGTYTGLTIIGDDFDFYSVSVDDGATLNVDIFFLDDDVDMDLYLWDPLIGCDSSIEGENAPTALSVGFSVSDDEFVTYTNLSGAPQDIIIEARRWSGDAAACGNYDMQISGSAGPGGGGGFGTNFCMANANSTGVTGEISAMGSRVAANNDVTLMGSNLPTQAFAFFLVSSAQGFVPNPGGSQGNLCLGGAIGRYVGAGQIQQSDLAGEISLALDLTQVPQPTGFISITGGQTWNFQAWYRDAVGGSATSNFTDGLSIDFL